MIYGYFKHLVKRTALDKVLSNEAFNIAKNLKYDEYQTGLAPMVYRFIDKKASGSGANNELKQNDQVVEELHKPIISKFKKEKYIHHSKTIFGVLI